MLSLVLYLKFSMWHLSSLFSNDAENYFSALILKAVIRCDVVTLIVISPQKRYSLIASKVTLCLLEWEHFLKYGLLLQKHFKWPSAKSLNLITNLSA